MLFDMPFDMPFDMFFDMFFDTRLGPLDMPFDIANFIPSTQLQSLFSSSQA
jgi:hypothetical protein